MKNANLEVGTEKSRKQAPLHSVCRAIGAADSYGQIKFDATK